MQKVKADKAGTAGGLEVIDCGLADFRAVLEKQYELRDRRKAGLTGDTVLIAEHNPVITLGARDSANRLLVEPDVLSERGIEVVKIRRGGGVTAHNPGQVVLYPILELAGLHLCISDYIRRLEGIGGRLLEELGVNARRRKGFPGLWVGGRKIASIGVRVSRGISYHGMAINIDNELGIFDLFVPCGLEGVKMTSVFEQTHRRYEMQEVKARLVRLSGESLS